MLLVEDNETDVVITLEHLADTAPTVAVDVARSGMEALERVDADGYDLVVLDLNLPSMDGREVLRRVRSRWPDLPIVVVTTSSSEADREASFELGADGFVVKPMSLHAYETLLDELVEQWLPGDHGRA